MKKRRLKQELLFLLFLLFFSLANFLLDEKLTKPISHFLKDGISFLIQIPRNRISKEKGVELFSTIHEKELANEIEELKQALSLNKTLVEYEIIHATPIYRNPNFWRNEMIIDKGIHDGVEKEMPVIVLEGLIGKIKEVGEYSSTVELLTKEDDLKISVKVEMEEGYIYGILTEYEKKEGVFKMEGISDQRKIEEGSIVTTTGMGGHYPSGIYIGRTNGIHKDHFDLTETVDVKSDVTFEDIGIVSVLKRKEDFQ